MSDTIYAMSSGAPPSAIAIIRISGARAVDAGRQLAGTMPAPRRATLRVLRDARGDPLDQALMLFFPGPVTATGEDLLELHCHGGRAVVAAVTRALGSIPGLRLAEAGEFTRRALENGRIDLAQAEGLADLLEAETEEARVAALAAAEGAVGQRLRVWFDTLLAIRAECEALIDYAEEDDVERSAVAESAMQRRIAALAIAIRDVLARPTVERLRDGPVVVLGGPRNAGKSSLFNALLSREASIVTPIAGTTRDVVEAVVQRNGRAFRLVDTAGLADHTDDPVERVGIERARQLLTHAALVLWLGPPEDAPSGALLVHSRSDERTDHAKAGSVTTSIHDQSSIEGLWTSIEAHTADRSHAVDAVRLHERQAAVMGQVVGVFDAARHLGDHVLIAEELRRATVLLSDVVGVDATHATLDALFSRFCLGK